MLSSVVSSSADFCATSASRRCVTSSSRAFSSAAAAWPASVVSRRASASVWVWAAMCRAHQHAVHAVAQNDRRGHVGAGHPREAKAAAVSCEYCRSVASATRSSVQHTRRSA